MWKFAAVLLTLCMTAQLTCISAFAASSDDEESTDYSVSGVAWDVSDSNARVTWDVGDGKTSYKVQIYYSSTLLSKYRVGEAKTVSYSAGQVDVTSLITKHGSGTFYAVVTCSKKDSSTGEKNSAVSDGEYIDSDSIAKLKANYKGSDSGNTTGTGTSSSGPGQSVSGSWQQNTDGTWSYILSGNTKAAGWQSIGGKWYCFDASGLMYASRWIQSTSEAGVWFYVGANGDMQVNTTTPDGFTVDADGKWKQ